MATKKKHGRIVNGPKPPGPTRAVPKTKVAAKKKAAQKKRPPVKKTASRVRGFLREEKVDIVHCKMWGGQSWPQPAFWPAVTLQPACNSRH